MIYTDLILYGDERQENLLKALDPQELDDQLFMYQETFGDEFTIKDLLMVMDIRAKALIASAIVDAPAYYFDQMGIAQKADNFVSGDKALDRIADVLERYEENN